MCIRLTREIGNTQAKIDDKNNNDMKGWRKILRTNWKQNIKNNKDKKGVGRLKDESEGYTETLIKLTRLRWFPIRRQTKIMAREMGRRSWWEHDNDDEDDDINKHDNDDHDDIDNHDKDYDTDNDLENNEQRKIKRLCLIVV